MDIKANKADAVRETAGMRTDLPDETAVAVDYETYYSTADGYSLSAAGMTPQKYCDDDRFDPYLVSIYGPGISPDLPADEDGNQLYVGRPEDFRSWDRLADRILLAHNAGFDSVVTDRCIRLGLIPRLPGIQWQDTIDLARFLLTPGSLRDSMKYLFGREISKAVRAGMDGRRPGDLTAEEYGDLLRYGGDDAKECRLIWSTYAGRWPAIEREISCQNREAVRRGFRIDLPYAEESLRVLRRIQEEALADLPWVTKIDPRTRTYYKPSSTKALSEEIRLLGVEPPSTFKKDAPEFLAWLEDHRDVPFIKARLAYASTIQHVKRLENLIASADRDSLVHPGLIYFGAHTGRFSAGFSDASSKGENRNINMLNMPRSAVFKGRGDVFGGKGIDLRGMYIPRPGYRFVIFDYSQIEARFALWLAGDDGMLDALRTEGNLYQANAVKMGWCKSGSDIKHTDPETYQMAKRCALGLTYQMGAVKFIDTTKASGADFPSLPREEWPDLERNGFYLRNVAKIADIHDPRNEKYIGQVFRSRQIVDQWRQANARIAAKWGFYKDAFTAAANAHRDRFCIRLRSGRVKTYFNPKVVARPSTRVDDEGKAHPEVRYALQAQTVLGKKPSFFTGGNLLENVVQATCRDIMTYGAVEISRLHPSWKFCWSCYDEVIFEVPVQEVDEALVEMPRIMCRGDLIREWTEGLPLEVEGAACDRYCK